VMMVPSFHSALITRSQSTPPSLGHRRPRWTCSKWIPRIAFMSGKGSEPEVRFTIRGHPNLAGGWSLRVAKECPAGRCRIGRSAMANRNPLVVPGRRCIYCLEYKASSEFNREHVMPQALGSFEGQSPTIKCVCKCCNDHLGQELEQSFGHQSFEGTHRFVAGLRPAADFRSHLPSDIGGILFKDGPLAGSMADFRPLPDGSAVELLQRPQVGFAKTSEGPFRWYSVGNLPSREELRALFGDDTPSVRWMGRVDDQQVRSELARKCEIASSGEVLTEHLPGGVAQADVMASITQKHQRTIAKIAFAYLAFSRLEWAYLPELDETRRYVRWSGRNQSPIRSVVPCPPDSPRRMKEHEVSVEYDGSVVWATVITFGILMYRLALNTAPLMVPATLKSRHRFDLQARQAKHCL
jgi:hypothetical protein